MTSKAAAKRLNGITDDPTTVRGRRRDQKARGMAAAALLNVKDPPKDIRYIHPITPNYRDSRG